MAKNEAVTVDFALYVTASTSDTQFCGEYTYTLTSGDLSPLVTLDTATGVLTAVSTSKTDLQYMTHDQQYTMTYELSLKTYPSVTKSVTLEFTLFDSCTTSTVTLDVFTIPTIYVLDPAGVTEVVLSATNSEADDVMGDSTFCGDYRFVAEPDPNTNTWPFTDPIDGNVIRLISDSESDVTTLTPNPFPFILRAKLEDYLGYGG